MKIFDCFMYFNEDIVLDIRLNHLSNIVEKFVIVESNYTHSGEFKKFNFDINKYKKFKDKIIYVQIDEKPKTYQEINKDLPIDKIKEMQISNAIILENFQRNQITKGLQIADDNDFILISDVDEIPNLNEINLNKYSNKIVLFKQFFFNYKLNLYLKDFFLYGTKGCKKKILKSPQWLRNVKSKKYNYYRLDVFFSETKYHNIHFVKNGGWHFSNLLDENGMIYKLKSFLHHADLPDKLFDKNLFKNLIAEKKIMYDHEADKTGDKYSKKKDLSTFDLELLPDYIKNNKDKFKDWLV